MIAKVVSIGIVVLGMVLSGCGSNPGSMDPEEMESEILDSGWEVLEASPGPGAPNESPRHDDIFFITPMKGWLANTRGEVHVTEDGGETWAQLYTNDEIRMRSIGFASETKGWIGNLNDFNNPAPQVALFETEDGGHSWTNISDRVEGTSPTGICGIHVIDPETIFAVGRWNGPAVFVRSLDGGSTWEGIDLSSFATGLVDVYFFNPEDGLVVGGLGVGNSADEQNSSQTVILATSDGGNTWETVYKSEQQGKWAWKISFPTLSVGYVSTQGRTLDGVVLKTTDGGQTWTELIAASGHGFSGIGFITESLGWVASDTMAFETIDGGASWKSVNLGESVNRFRFPSQTVGYATGKKVYRYVEKDDL